MGSRSVLGVMLVMVGFSAAGLTLPTQAFPAAEQNSPGQVVTAKEAKNDSICVDVVIEEVDLSTNTITASSTIHVVPPHDNVGGQVAVTGTTGSHQDKTTKYVRLPVMPEARLKEVNPKAGLHAILHLKMLRQGSLVVVGIEEFTGVERIGVDWLDAPGTKIRVGTYDSRAIAVAYASSRFNPVKDKMADFAKAKAAGDRAKMKELQVWGEQFQRQLHFQGFGRVPVDDLLSPVKDAVAKLSRERQLAAITMSCEFTSEEVELVDVTDDLVKLYSPSAKTLEHVREIRKVKPTPLAKLSDVPAQR